MLRVSLLWHVHWYSLQIVGKECNLLIPYNVDVDLNHLRTSFICEAKKKMLQWRMSLLRRHNFTQIVKCTGRVRIGPSLVDLVISDLQTKLTSAVRLLQSCGISLSWLDQTGGSLWSSKGKLFGNHSNIPLPSSLEMRSPGVPKKHYTMGHNGSNH